MLGSSVGKRTLKESKAPTPRLIQACHSKMEYRTLPAWVHAWISDVVNILSSKQPEQRNQKVDENFDVAVKNKWQDSPLKAGLGLAWDALGANVAAVCFAILLSSWSRLSSLLGTEPDCSVLWSCKVLGSKYRPRHANRHIKYYAHCLTGSRWPTWFICTRP